MLLKERVLDKIQVSRTYDTVVILMSLVDTVCPDFLERDVQAVISKCFEALPDRFEVVLSEDPENG